MARSSPLFRTTRLGRFAASLVAGPMQITGEGGEGTNRRGVTIGRNGNEMLGGPTIDPSRIGIHELTSRTTELRTTDHVIRPIPLFHYPQDFHSNSQIHPQYLAHILRAVSPMNSERRDFELWRTGDWRCEWWSVGGQPQVRLYLGQHQVADLMPGPHLDLWRQTAEWRAAALADQQQH